MPYEGEISDDAAKFNVATTEETGLSRSCEANKKGNGRSDVRSDLVAGSLDGIEGQPTRYASYIVAVSVRFCRGREKKIYTKNDNLSLNLGLEIKEDPLHIATRRAARALNESIGNGSRLTSNNGRNSSHGSRSSRHKDGGSQSGDESKGTEETHCAVSIEEEGEVSCELDEDARDEELLAKVAQYLYISRDITKTIQSHRFENIQT
jgi:hypothetical protein